MSNNQNDEATRRRAEADQKSTAREPVEADSQASEKAPEAQPRPGERPDLDWTDHED